MLTKILKIVFIFLILITAGELVYYITISNKNNKYTPETDITNFSSIPTINPTDIDKFAFHPEVLDIYKKAIYNPNVRTIIRAENRAKIMDIALNGLEFKGRSYPFAIKLSNGPDEKDAYWIYMPEFSVAKTKVYIRENEIDKPISFNELNKGDNVIFIEEFNPHFAPTDQRQLVSQFIYKLK